MDYLYYGEHFGYTGAQDLEDEHPYSTSNALNIHNRLDFGGRLSLPKYLPSHSHSQPLSAPEYRPRASIPRKASALSSVPVSLPPMTFGNMNLPFTAPSTAPYSGQAAQGTLFKCNQDSPTASNSVEYSANNRLGHPHEHAPPASRQTFFSPNYTMQQDSHKKQQPSSYMNTGDVSNSTASVVGSGPHSSHFTGKPIAGFDLSAYLSSSSTAMPPAATSRSSFEPEKRTEFDGASLGSIGTHEEFGKIPSNQPVNTPKFIPEDAYHHSFPQDYFVSTQNTQLPLWDSFDPNLVAASQESYSTNTNFPEPSPSLFNSLNPPSLSFGQPYPSEPAQPAPSEYPASSGQQELQEYGLPVTQTSYEYLQYAENNQFIPTENTGDFYGSIDISAGQNTTPQTTSDAANPYLSSSLTLQSLPIPQFPGDPAFIGSVAYEQYDSSMARAPSYLGSPTGNPNFIPEKAEEYHGHDSKSSSVAVERPYLPPAFEGTVEAVCNLDSIPLPSADMLAFIGKTSLLPNDKISHSSVTLQSSFSTIPAVALSTAIISSNSMKIPATPLRNTIESIPSSFPLPRPSLDASIFPSEASPKVAPRPCFPIFRFSFGNKVVSMFPKLVERYHSDSVKKSLKSFYQPSIVRVSPLSVYFEQKLNSCNMPTMELKQKEISKIIEAKIAATSGDSLLLQRIMKLLIDQGGSLNGYSHI